MKNTLMADIGEAEVPHVFGVPMLGGDGELPHTAIDATVCGVVLKPR